MNWAIRSQPGTREDTMTWNVTEIRTTKKELLVEVCQKDAKMLDFLAN